MEDKKMITDAEKELQDKLHEQPQHSTTTHSPETPPSTSENTTHSNHAENISTQSTSSEQENISSPAEDEKTILMKKIEELNQQLAELNDKHIRLLAEFDNYRKRTRKEKEDLIKYAGEDIWKAILPIIDDFERAIKENQNTTDIDVIKKGFELIYNKLKHITQQNKLVAIDSLHKEFNADTMEAVAKVPAPSEYMRGKVVDELEKAYQLNDKIIRHAKVVVGE